MQNNYIFQNKKNNREKSSPISVFAILFNV